MNVKNPYKEKKDNLLSLMRNLKEIISTFHISHFTRKNELDQQQDSENCLPYLLKTVSLSKHPGSRKAVNLQLNLQGLGSTSALQEKRCSQIVGFVLSKPAPLIN